MPNQLQTFLLEQHCVKYHHRTWLPLHGLGGPNIGQKSRPSALFGIEVKVMTSKGSPLIKNPLSLTGMVLAMVGIATAVVLGILTFTKPEPSPYLSILAWIAAPGVAYLGIFALVAGLFLERRRRHRAAPDQVAAHFQIDLNQPGLHRTLYAVVVTAILLLMGTGVGTYQAYEFTESTAFCAATCHSVMAPERVTHRISPHAQVECAACHVGRTPVQYLEAKLYGLKELYLLATNKYPRPIPTPVHVMQPLRENCANCHWERIYWGKLHRDYSHYIAANDNQRWTVKMNVKVGGMYRFGGEGEGIHWHMKIKPKVQYIATDARLQKIPWVRVVEDGREVIFRSAEDQVSDADLVKSPVREMTCVDCHSRPAHQFKAPILAIDDAMARGYIDPLLPQVKAKGVELLAARDYTTQEGGMLAIRERLLAYYQKQHPEVFRNQQDKLHRAANALATLYQQNFFPEMKSDWRAYPDNIGHFVSDGYFRCHDGLHTNAEGKAISNDCSLCHEIVVQGPPDATEANPSGLPFRHPIDVGVPIGELGRCTTCHDGTLGG